jgi:hypothetical protein
LSKPYCSLIYINTKLLHTPDGRVKNSDVNREVVEHDTFIPICKIFRPLLIVMTLVGLYHDSGKEICVTANGEIIAMDRSFRRRALIKSRLLA